MKVFKWIRSLFMKPSFAHATSGIRDALEELKEARDLHNQTACNLAIEAAMLDEQRKAQHEAAMQCQSAIGNIGSLIGDIDG